MIQIVKKLPENEHKIWAKAKEIPCFEYPVFKAIDESHPDCCSVILHQFPAMMYACNKFGTPPLVYAVQTPSEKQIRIIELMLSNSKCVGFMLNQKNGNNENALYQAVEKRLQSVVQLLIEYGAKVSLNDVENFQILNRIRIKWITHFKYFHVFSYIQA